MERWANRPRGCEVQQGGQWRQEETQGNNVQCIAQKSPKAGTAFKHVWKKWILALPCFFPNSFRYCCSEQIPFLHPLYLLYIETKFKIHLKGRGILVVLRGGIARPIF